ncbi:MAG: DNA mismatch repair endonuclease MutL [Selenomonadales bacterium]|nr:DNA mismatch repair endonuclease MutL [Selenomonadales bacterium]
MASLIQVLDEQTINKIAAGEVVERPSSVVKELVENAIDAGATEITIEVAGGGEELIRVSDNGKGMTREDAQLAVLRHATSKIRCADDLTQVLSLGFRGEALASISAVSRFTLQTRQEGNALGTEIVIEGGTMLRTEDAGCGLGTTITVEDLFFNTPARKKFLKKPQTETTNINYIVTKLSLSHPEIAFKLIANQKMLVSTPGTNKLFDTIGSLYGAKVAEEILPIDKTEDGVTVRGYLAKPAVLKSNRQWQTFLVNGRTINSRFLAKAIDNAYHSLLPKSGFPMVVLELTLPTEDVDINVHPQKSEVKFADESKLYRLVYHAVTEVLTNVARGGDIASDVEKPRYQAYIPQPPKQREEYPRLDFGVLNAPSMPSVPSKPSSVTYTPRSSAVYESQRVAEMSAPWETSEPTMPLSTAYAMKEQPLPQAIVQELPVQEERCERFYPMGQVYDCYIVAQNDNGLFLVDQHAAHERILYDRFAAATDSVPSQQLLIPQIMEFTEDECEIISENEAIFMNLGFSLDLIGPQTFRLKEMPADVPSDEAEAIIREILMAYRNMHEPSARELRHHGLQIAACRAAVKAGETMTMRQMQILLNELSETTMPYTCPHGRPCMIRFDIKDLDKMFKRI